MDINISLGQQELKQKVSLLFSDVNFFSRRKEVIYAACFQSKTDRSPWNVGTSDPVSSVMFSS